MRIRRLGATAVVPLMALALVAPAQATTSATNPGAPFLANHGFTSAPWGSPVLAQDGSGILAVYVSPKADGRHLYVSRWTPAHGWGPASQLFVGALEGGFGVQAYNGVAAVWWTDLVGSSVRRMHVSMRDGVAGSWGSEQQIFRSNMHAWGGVALGAGGVTAVWTIPDGPDPSTLHAALNAQAWDPIHGWGAPQTLATSATYRGFELAAVGDRFVTTWVDVSGAIDYTVRVGSTWSPPAETASAAQECTYRYSVGSAQRYISVLQCGSSNAYELRDWSGSSTTPVVTQVSTPAFVAPQVNVAVSGTQAALISCSSAGKARVLLQRSSSPGTWTTATTAVSSATCAGVAISGSTAIVVWEDYSPATRSSRLLSRTTAAPDGAFTSTVRQVSGWSPKYWSNLTSSLSTGPSGAVMTWVAVPNRAVPSFSVQSVQAATWTPRGGWSAPHTLVAPAYRYVLDSGVPSVVVGSNAMVGWASPTTDGATAATLVGPKATSPARVTRSGRTLTCTAPAFAPRPATIAYRWQVNGRAVASGRVLRVSGALLGKPLVCRAIASTQGFVPGSAYAPPAVVRA